MSWPQVCRHVTWAQPFIITQPLGPSDWSTSVHVTLAGPIRLIPQDCLFRGTEEKKSSFLVVELEMGCWQTSSPRGESMSLEGEKEATTTQGRAEFRMHVRAREKELTTISFKSLNFIVSGLPLIWAINLSFYQTDLVEFLSYLRFLINQGLRQTHPIR